MSSITTVDYLGDNLIAGEVVTREGAPLAADTYYRGMPLKMNVGGTAYEYTATVPEVIYNGPERTLSGAGIGSIIVAGEVDSRGIVDDSGDALTVTQAMITNAKKYGLIIKLKGD